MPTNTDFAHVAPRLSAEILSRLAVRQERENLRSLTAALRAELEERLAAGGPFGPVLAAPASAVRKDFWLPRALVEEIRCQARTCDANPSLMLVTILEAQPEARAAHALKWAPSAAPAVKRRSPLPGAPSVRRTG